MKKQAGNFEEAYLEKFGSPEDIAAFKDRIRKQLKKKGRTPSAIAGAVTPYGLGSAVTAKRGRKKRTSGAALAGHLLGTAATAGISAKMLKKDSPRLARALKLKGLNKLKGVRGAIKSHPRGALKALGRNVAISVPASMILGGLGAYVAHGADKKRKKA